jgi:dGTP triphosphohydrolase
LDDKAQGNKWGEEAWELYCRTHLVVDYLAGMTDDYAFRIFQLFSGARLG